MGHLLRQSGFGLVVLYCLLRLYELLWAHTRFPFMLQVIMLAALCYLAQRALLLRRQGLRLTLGEQGVIAVYGIVAFSVVAQYAFLGSTIDTEGIDTFDYTLSLFVNSTFWMLAGAAMSTRQLNLSVSRSVVILAIVLLILDNARGEDILFVDYGKIIAESALTQLSHLNVAEFVVLLIFLCYASVRRLRMLVFAAGVLALFMLSGRSSLYFTIFSIGVFELLRGGNRNMLRSVAALTGLVAVVALLFFVALQSGVIDEDNKFVQQILFIDGLEEDTSYIERQYITDNSYRLLPAQFLFGNPKLIASNFGHMGSYLHNLLSVWQFFGFPAFIGMVALLVACCLRMRSALISDAPPIIVFGSLLLIYTVVSVIVSKAVGFRLLWVSIGFWMLQPDLVFRRRITLRRRRRHRHRYRRFFFWQRRTERA